MLRQFAGREEGDRADDRDQNKTGEQDQTGQVIWHGASVAGCITLPKALRPRSAAPV